MFHGIQELISKLGIEIQRINQSLISMDQLTNQPISESKSEAFDTKKGINQSINQSTMHFISQPIK